VYDLIGDIHGHAKQLEALLYKLGYRETSGVYRHPSHTAIFVGDFIDRGPYNRRVVEIAMHMVKTGAALAVIGNHELNALCYHTPDPEQPGEYLRPHNAKNGGQHGAFLEQYADDAAARQEALDWFRTLPLFLDLGEIRVVHACWHAPSIRRLHGWLGEDGMMTEAFLERCARKGTPEREAVDTVLKGPELILPGGITFRDKEGNERNEARIRWWSDKASDLAEQVEGPPPLKTACRGHPPIDHGYSYPLDGPPVFFGHYWLKGEPKPQSEVCACLDYSVAGGGPLVAYRWDGERRLSSANFVAASRLETT
jgi:hypothetical protein